MAAITRLIAWPPALGPNGAVVCPPHQTAAQQVAILLGTRPGERPDAPTFGLAAEPGQLAVNHHGVTAAVKAFLPDIAAQVTATHQTDRNGRYHIEVSVSHE